jgi:hypothetical protein
MNTLSIKGWISVVSVSALLAFSVGCGSNNSSSAPAPAAPGASVNPYGTNCQVGMPGTPVNPNGSPYYGSLQSASMGPNSMVGGDSLALGFNYLNYSAPTPGGMVQNIVGSGSFVFPDLTYILGPNNPNANTNICVSSSTLGGTGINPGTFNLGNGAVSMTMTGVILTPLYNPYAGYPGSYQPYPTTQTSQSNLILNIGMSCPAYLVNNRVLGCVSVQLAGYPYGNTLNYYSR